MREKPLILVVDDEDDFREITCTRLRTSGFDCVEARGEKEALEQATLLQPDLVLMDIHMPGESGTDAALALRQNLKTRHLRIVFLTSLRHPWPRLAGNNKGVAEELGVEEFFDKAKDMESLPQKIAALLGRGGFVPARA